MTTATKTIDSKGRVALGAAYAGRSVVVVEESEDSVVLRFGENRFVPDRERWLWDNDVAKAMVARGLQQASSGDMSDGPDLGAAFSFAESIPDE